MNDPDPPMQRRSPLFWLAVASFSAGAGVLYDVAFGEGSANVGWIYGLMIGLVVTAFEQGLILDRLRQRIRRLPTIPFLLAAEVAYAAMVIVGNTVAGSIVWVLGLVPDTYLHLIRVIPSAFVFSLVVSAILVTAFRVRDLIGGEVLASLLLGRYRQPVEEERIFLFVDLIGSTAYASQNGDLRTQRYLSTIFAAMAEPVQRHRGAIDDYVGDMALITWPLARGIEEARCVACVYAITDAIESHAARWRAEFGQVPRLRAALHGGPVVTAEVGIDRHKIAYFGDTVNTTARLEALARTLDAPVVISDDLLALLPRLPDGVSARSLGSHAARGRDALIGVASLERPAAAGRRQPQPAGVLARLGDKRAVAVRGSR